MRSILPITLILLLLTLSMTPFATAQQAKANIIINQTTETLYVISSTKYGAEGAVPAGHRTSGWNTIAAGEQKTFWAYDPHKIYFQIFKGSEPIKPQQTTQTFAFWIHRNANFDIVTRAVINAAIPRDQLLYSNHNTDDLIHSDGFMRYNNGSRITVTDAWVAVVESDPKSPVNISDIRISIPDANLRRAIAAELGKTAGTPITATALRTLTSLNSKQSGIQDLTGLEFATNLIALSLSNNHISDISLLANLANLNELDLDSNQILDISPLANLANLTVLSLSNNQISDISPLTALRNLTALDLARNYISDISPLANLANLTALDLTSNEISDFSPIDRLLPNLIDYSNGYQVQQQTGIEPIELETPVVSDPQLNIYWAQSRQSSDGGYLPTSIWRANLETKTIRAIVSDVHASDLTIDPAGGKIYWINTSRTPSGETTDTKIQCANLDGSDPQDLFIPDGQTIGNLTLDGVGGICWINRDWSTDSHKIQRANLDGSNVQDILTNIHPWEFAIDAVSRTIYWVDWLGEGVDKIRRAHLDGSNIQDFYTTAANPGQLIIDAARRKIYWEDIDYSTGESVTIIRRANLDGSNIKALLTTELSTPLTLDSSRNMMYLATGAVWNSFWNVRWSNLDRSDNFSFFDSFSQVYIPWTESGRPHLTVDPVDGTLYWTEYDEIQGNFGIGRRTLDGEAEKIITDVDYGISALVVASVPPQPPDLWLSEPLLESKDQDYILHGFIGQEGQIDGVVFSPDGRTLASIGINGTLLHLDPHALRTNPRLTEDVDQALWDIALREAQMLKQERGSRSAAYSPNGRWLALGTSDKTIQLWDVEAATLIHTLSTPEQVWAVAFSPDGTTLASGGSYDRIYLWDVRRVFLKPPEIKSTLMAETAQVEGIVFHPDGQTLAVATGKRDEVVHLWDLQTETLKDTLMAPHVSIRHIAFSPDGQMLAGGAYSTGGQYGQGEGVLLWKQAPLPPDILANLTPHSVEISGPTIIGPAGHTYTVHVKNARGIGIQNALVSAKVPKGQTNTRNLVTDEQGNASIHLQFPGIGKYDINVTVSERVTQQALKKTFPDRVEVPRPHAIAAAGPQPEPRARETYYRDAFTVTSADGQLLEGFYVNSRIATTSYSSITDNEGIAPVSTQIPYPGTHNVNVAVLAGGRNSQEILKKTFPRRAIIYIAHTCGTLMPDTIERLDQVRVPRHYEQTEVSKGIWEYQESTGSVKAAVQADVDRGNRTWTIHDTVAEEENGIAELVLTVKFLSSTEARRLTLLDSIKSEALVSPKETLMENIKLAAKDWATHSNMRWKYIMPGTSGKSDIRIAFLDPDVQTLYESQVGSPSDNDTVYDRSVTMALSTNVPYGTILHEFGHALGLMHEHLSPQFAKRFEWDDTEPVGWADTYPDLEWDSIPREDRIYKKIAFHRPNSYNAKTIKKGDKDARRIDRNYLKVRTIDEAYSEFDNTSVMTYELEPELLKTKPGASDADRALVDEEWAAENGEDPPPGIGRYAMGETQQGEINYEGYERLSARDRKFIADLYGQPLRKAQVSGTIEIDGIDHDFGDPDDKIKTTRSVSATVIPDAAEYVRAHDPIKFKWGGEMRVEVHIHSREINYEDQFVELAITALLYHGGSENDTDLDAYRCGSVKASFNREVEMTVTLSNSFFGFSGSKWCGGVEVNAEESGLVGDLLSGVNWWNKADLTIKLTVEGVAHDTPVTAPLTAPSIAPIVKTADPKHDVNADGEINAADLLLVSQYFGRIPPETPAVDVNKDHTVTIADLVQVAQHLQRSRVPAAPTGGMPPKLTYRTVEGWIDTARSESDGSRVFQIGIANLEALLLLIVPEETVLLMNYPNPFNPETWIPYHLSEPADVALTIYAIDGKVVRHLDLGHQAAGYYENKARAAHWDGRNHVGERVASGVYFYTLTTGDFTATRKMLIRK